ncbi:MAG: D-alanyl-D-alanine carboxypeptidase family protein [Micavibrio sp.]|nr:D-alanyl-D-alanine carboxypeptidase family protein [Micavibrio sp.]
MLTLRHSLISGFKKFAAAFVLVSFVFVAATSFDVAAAENGKTKPKTTQHAKAKKTTAKSSATKKKQTAQRSGGYNPRHGSIVIDAATGTILSQNGADTQVYPASLTKLMTLLITFEALEKGTASLNQSITFSNHAAAQVPSKLDIPAGSSIVLKNAIYAIVTKSANDVAVAVAENIGGTEGRFVYLMNQKAKEIGMNNTRFVNPSGLHNPSQVTTPRDFATLSRYIVKNYPREYRYFATRSFTYNGIANRNHNRLMETYSGMDGMKTGYTIPSGFNLAASAVRNNRRLIAVVMGGKTAQARNTEVAGLLDEGFEKIRTMGAQQLVASNTQAPQQENRLAATTGTAGLQQSTVPGTALPQPGQPVPAKIAAIDPNPTPMPVNNAMSEMAGQGDIDPAVTRRFETGMMAINAIKTLKPGQVSAVPANMGSQHATYDPSGAPTPQLSGDSNQWAIQLGSFNSRVQGDQALAAAVTKLPAGLRTNAKPIIVPLKAGEGWVYRARLQGFSQAEASAACKNFNNCLAISPRAF